MHLYGSFSYCGFGSNSGPNSPVTLRYNKPLASCCRALYHKSVRRASAMSLLFAICFPTIVAPAFADEEANLPQCCRRTGIHHCSMGQDEGGPAGGTSFQSIQTRCPACPIGAAASASPDFAFLKASVAIFASVVSHPSTHFQTEARYRVSFSRTRQKRGPPALS